MGTHRGWARGIAGGLATVVAVAALSGVPAGGTEGLTATVVARVAAVRSVVRLSDCVQFTGTVPDGLGAMGLATAPLAGRQEVLTRGQIAAVLTGMGIRDVAWAGADACVVTTPAETIPADRLVAAATKAVEDALPPPGADAAYVVTPMTQPDAVVVPARPWTLAPILPPSVGLGIVTVGIRVMEDGTLLRTAMIPIEIGLRASVLVTVDALPYHTAIGPSAVRLEVHTTTTPNVSSFHDPAAVAEMWTTQSIPAGTVLTRQMVAPMPAVQRGAMVTVVVQRGTLWISAEGQAQDDAVVGQMVPVKILSTGVTVTGRVTGTDTVELSLP